jgi:SRSO17 transposase
MTPLLTEDRTLVPPFDDDRAARLTDYAGDYRDLFGRADQAKWFGLYVRGLLAGPGRKNVEAIAGQVSDAEPAAAVAQSLQHFVSHSPWEADHVFARYRSLVRPDLGPGTWVVHDAVIPKKGRHSVGVQRQFARGLGRKVNCQLAVVIAHVGEAGYYPLAARLYLPAAWLREYEDSLARRVPARHREPTSKPDVALALIDELLADDVPRADVAAEDGFAGSAAFRDGLASRRLAASPDADRALSTALGHFDWLKDGLGLQHFEGRTWAGWHHHVSLVFAAYGFLARERLGPDSPPFPRPEAETWAI